MTSNSQNFTCTDNNKVFCQLPSESESAENPAAWYDSPGQGLSRKLLQSTSAKSPPQATPNSAGVAFCAVPVLVLWGVHDFSPALLMRHWPYAFFIKSVVAWAYIYLAGREDNML